jgi:hypothetical protein
LHARVAHPEEEVEEVRIAECALGSALGYGEVRYDINSWHSVAENGTGIGVVAGLVAGVGMREWPYWKIAQPGSYRSYLQI